MIKDTQYGKSHYNHPDYTVTRDGRVYSWKSGKPELREGHRGKYGVTHSMDGESHTTHYLVMTIWGGDQMDNICAYRKIKHIDGNICNNDLDNLCYATQAEYNEFRQWYRSFISDVRDMQQRSY